MGQSFFTSIGGIKAAQTQINVVADNLANINTIGFKQSSVTFADVFYNTMSSGSAPTRDAGGTNPMQAGFGTQVASIDRNFTNGATQSTGNGTDMNIQGQGFFSVINQNKEVLYTRAGNFNLDSNGNFVLPNGNKLLGIGQAFSTQSGSIPVQIPQLIQTSTVANAKDLATKNLASLNNLQFATGTFKINVTTPTGTNVVTVNLGDDPATAGVNETVKTMGDIRDRIQDAIDAAAGDATTPFDADAITVACDNTTGGKLSIKVVTDSADDDPVNSISLEAGTSTFLASSDLSSNTPIVDPVTHTTTFSTKVLDYKQNVGVASSPETGVKYSGMNIYEDGKIEVKYSNGDKMTVMKNEADDKLSFKYTTSNGVIIKGDDVSVDGSVAIPANLQMQLSNFINANGLIAMGGSTYAKGENSGDATYGIPNTNGFSSLQTGALESSNVDMTKQFADMIIAQRAIESNSRVFSTQNEIMKSLVYMGS